MKRRGRPRHALKPARAEITRQVRAAIDGQGGYLSGNVHAMSNLLGIPTATLRDLYTGQCVAPTPGTLRALEIVGVALPP